MLKKIFKIIFTLAVVVAALYLVMYYMGPREESVTDKEQACTDSGGAVRTSLCCEATGDFPNLCLVGPCGCSPDNSHEVKICDCGEGCFDGSKCVQQEFSEGEEVKLTYNVAGCGIREEKEYTRSRGKEEKVDFKIDNGFINLTHYLNYVCCAEVKVYLDSVEEHQDYTLIKLKEKNEGEFCRCICNYEVDAKIGPLESGKYRVQIWGVEYEDMPVELLWEKEMSL